MFRLNYLDHCLCFLFHIACGYLASSAKENGNGSKHSSHEFQPCINLPLMPCFLCLLRSNERILGRASKVLWGAARVWSWEERPGREELCPPTVTRGAAPCPPACVYVRLHLRVHLERKVSKTHYVGSIGQMALCLTLTSLCKESGLKI